MKKEFWAEFDLYKTLEFGKEGDNKELIDSIVDRVSESGFTRWKFNPFLRQQILAQVLASQAEVRYIKKDKPKSEKAKEYARTGKLQDQEPSGLLFWYYGYKDTGKLKVNPQNPSGVFQDYIYRQIQKYVIPILGSGSSPNNCYHPTIPNLSIFPPGSWAVQIYFTLRKPYISKDDVDFYILDNPVKKEWVFKVPYVAPSQWKGALRSVMIRELASKLENGKISEDEFIEERLRLYRLFGNEKDGTAEFLNRVLVRHRIEPMPKDEGEKEKWQDKFKREVSKVREEFEQKLREGGYKIGNVEGFQGSLYFFPTFFDRIGLEVINPHDRRTGASARGPIYFECVPAGTKGIFTLLYVPIIGIDGETSPQDLKAVAKGIKAMLTQYGFGAKTSSGYGVAEVPNVEAEKVLKVNAEDVDNFYKAWNDVWGGKNG